jgi:hypothetical protein
MLIKEEIENEPAGERMNDWVAKYLTIEEIKNEPAGRRLNDRKTQALTKIKDLSGFAPQGTYLEMMSFYQNRLQLACATAEEALSECIRFDENKLEIGDFGFFEFKLCQIKYMENGKIKIVSNGHIEICGCDLSERWYPLSLRTKTISDVFFYYYEKFNTNKFQNILNYPDIHRWLVKEWVYACNTDNDISLNKYLNEVEDFYDKAIRLCDETTAQYLDGVKIIGR